MQNVSVAYLLMQHNTQNNNTFLLRYISVFNRVTEYSTVTLYCRQLWTETNYLY